jgi:hypothetical protein
VRPFSGLLARLRPPARTPPPPAAEPLPASVADGAESFQARLDEARERLRRDIPPPPPDDE